VTSRVAAPILEAPLLPTLPGDRVGRARKKIGEFAGRQSRSRTTASHLFRSRGIAPVEPRRSMGHHLDPCPIGPRARSIDHRCCCHCACCSSRPSPHAARRVEARSWERPPRRWRSLGCPARRSTSSAAPPPRLHPISAAAADRGLRLLQNASRSVLVKATLMASASRAPRAGRSPKAAQRSDALFWRLAETVRADPRFVPSGAAFEAFVVGSRELRQRSATDCRIGIKMHVSSDMDGESCIRSSITVWPDCGQRAKAMSQFRRALRRVLTVAGFSGRWETWRGVRVADYWRDIGVVEDVVLELQRLVSVGRTVASLCQSSLPVSNGRRGDLASQSRPRNMSHKIDGFWSVVDTMRAIRALPPGQAAYELKNSETSKKRSCRVSVVVNLSCPVDERLRINVVVRNAECVTRMSAPMIANGYVLLRKDAQSAHFLRKVRTVPFAVREAERIWLTCENAGRAD
jgi:hypothetical protein